MAAFQQQHQQQQLLYYILFYSDDIIPESQTIVAQRPGPFVLIAAETKVFAHS